MRDFIICLFLIVGAFVFMTFGFISSIAKPDDVRVECQHIAVIDFSNKGNCIKKHLEMKS